MAVLVAAVVAVALGALAWWMSERFPLIETDMDAEMVLERMRRKREAVLDPISGPKGPIV